MKKVLRVIYNYFCYCGIEKSEFLAVKKDVFSSNYKVWKLLHILMSAAFTFLFVNSLFDTLLKTNRIFYMILMIYSLLATVLYLFVLKKASIITQLMNYASVSMLFLLGCLVTQNNPSIPATTFIVFLLLAPMLIVDRPYFMIIELCGATGVFIAWMYYVKPYDVWQTDLVNVLIFLVVAVFIHIIANSVRIKEFVLTRQINIQKDTDELTGINNKAAITRKINKFLKNEDNNKGIMILFDIDRFKAINDTFGHDIGDVVLNQLGAFLKNKFQSDEIVGRFGGDEFIIFIKNNDDKAYASQVAEEIASGAAEYINYPEQKEHIQISLGIAIYNGVEKNYSEIFKKSDIALYRAKADKNVRYAFY